MLLVYCPTTLSQPGCISQARHAMQTCPDATHHCSMHRQLGTLCRMSQAAAYAEHAPTRVPQKDMPAHSARLAALPSRGRRSVAAAVSRSPDPSMHQAVAGGATSPYC